MEVAVRVQAVAGEVREHVDVVACRRLWCAVLLEQLKLAERDGFAARSFEVDAARNWFGSRDFFLVCTLCGLDGRWVLGGIRRRLAAQGIEI